MQAQVDPNCERTISPDNYHIAYRLPPRMVLAGVDHLLVGREGAGGQKGEEPDELPIACLMSFFSCLADRPEVLHISPAYRMETLNAAAFPNVQSATLTATPLSDAGLNGEGEIIQASITRLQARSATIASMSRIAYCSCRLAIFCEFDLLLFPSRVAAISYVFLSMV